ncbi:hypothetical protein COOONC_19570, partial [Cooperia oncophora]
MDEFGVRVFPSSSTNAIRNSIAVLHYAPAPPDPPIDYTLNRKPSSKVTSHGDIYTIPWREEHKSMSIQSQNRNGPAGVGKYRRDTAEESASVLEDLDHLLDNEELTLQQRMSRLE